jgi:hypothetical protein
LHATAPVSDLGKLNAYAYLLDLENAATVSTQTFGASFDGRKALGEGFDLLWWFEAATQQDYADNPVAVDAELLRGELGATYSDVTLKVGDELLEGSGDPGDKFTTPLATLHPLNGWADIFLNTPDTGLNDFYASLGSLVAKTSLELVWHQFTSDVDSLDYGTELDFLATRQIAKDGTLGFEYAHIPPTSSDPTRPRRGCGSAGRSEIGETRRCRFKDRAGAPGRTCILSWKVLHAMLPPCASTACWQSRGQAESCLGLIEAHEWRECLLDLARWKTSTTVLDLHHCTAIRKRAADLDRSPRGGVLHTVSEEIADRQRTNRTSTLTVSSPWITVRSVTCFASASTSDWSSTASRSSLSEVASLRSCTPEGDLRGAQGVVDEIASALETSVECLDCVAERGTSPFALRSRKAVCADHRGRAARVR